MRRIIKSVSPAWFEKWKEDFYKAEGRSAHYSDLEPMMRRQLREYLIGEQGGICCYCLRKISIDTSHIEHFKPRHKFGGLDLDYYNMYASCTGQEDEPQSSKWHCDPKKDDWYNPHMPEPTSWEYEKCVNYNIKGEVIPYHGNRHVKHALDKEIIDKLGLNAPFLVRNRRNAIMRSELFDDEDYTDKDWMEFIKYYDTMHDGLYDEYCNVFIMLMFAVVKAM